MFKSPVKPFSTTYKSVQIFYENLQTEFPKTFIFVTVYQTRSQSFPVGIFIVLFGKRGLERARGVGAKGQSPLLE